MRAVRQFALGLALSLPLVACVEVVGPSSEIIEDRCAARRVYQPSTVNASLRGYDCVTSDGTQSYVDYYELKVHQTGWVDLYLESFDFDAYLMLFDEFDTLIAENDDGGTGSDAWITAKLPPGRYYIAATSFDSGETGRYKLYVD